MSANRGWSQPVDATLYLEEEMECMVMGEGFHRGFTAAVKTELWDRWKRGESLKAIGRDPKRSYVVKAAPRRNTENQKGTALGTFSPRAACIHPHWVIPMLGEAPMGTPPAPLGCLN